MTKCSECRKPLAEFAINGHRVLVYTNWKCHLHRERQGVRKKATIVVPEKKISPSRQAWLKKRRAKRMARYQLARSHGFGSRIAVKLRDQTTVDIERLGSKN